MVNKTHTVKPSNIFSPIQVVTLADKDGNLLNSFGSAANIPISAGNVEGYSHINKFGYRDTIPNSFQTIWDGATDYTYRSAAVLSVISDTPLSDDG